jgi:prepilin-type N-terminal cleavage/methylation domain-containing protein
MPNRALRQTESSPRRRAAGGGRAFTLIELLVVITILTLLVTMLLPAYQKVKEAVYRARSQGRITELSNGCIRYSQDNKGLYPGQLDYAQLKGTSGGTFTGTQLLAACLFGFPYSAINPGNVDGNSLYAPYAPGDLITVSGKNNSIWDRYPRSAKMTVLYYPSRLGQAGMGQYIEGDNYDYTSGTSWLGGSFYTYITDPRVTSGGTPYRPGQFLLISAGIDGVCGTLDDLKNFGN